MECYYNLGGAYFSKEFRTMTPKRLKAPRPTTKALSDELVLLLKKKKIPLSPTEPQKKQLNTVQEEGMIRT